MDHYLDIRLRIDPEFATHQLMSALFSKLHRTLAQSGRSDIGLSFPQAQSEPAMLGEMLRLHGTCAALNSLMEQEWLGGMHGHIDLSSVLPVPAGCPHRQVRRIQADSNPQRLRRRLMRRHDIDMETARQRIPDRAAKRLNLPFVQVASASTRNKFLLFIEHGPLQATPVMGTFNAYGISREATLPWF